jgi:glycosidase
MWWRLRVPRSSASFDLDPGTGLLARFDLPGQDQAHRVNVATSAEILVGGSEARPVTGGIEYPGAHWLGGSLAKPDNVRTLFGVGEMVRRVPTWIEGWSVTWSYQLTHESPCLRTTLGVMRPKDDERPLRNLTFRFELTVEDPDEWELHAPGNRLKPGTPLGGLTHPIFISPAAGTMGSPGIVALSSVSRSACLVLWPFSRTEMGQVLVEPSPGGLSVKVTTDLAGDAPFGTELEYSGFYVDLREGTWRDTRPEVRSWYPSVGLRAPGAKPGWVRAANIYEVQVGRSVFSGGYHYEAYPRLADVVADLPRIVDLGFDTIQLMPKQPYPSYNVHDYGDVATSYGDESALRELVGRGHALGMHVILDVLLHGVIDRHSVRTALGGVEESKWLDRPVTEPGDVFADNPEARSALQRAWCQHIVDFAPHWIEGSPEKHHLTDDQPEWFCRDSEGNIIGIYTEAFDLANEAWQEYFSDAMVQLIDRFKIDGFRFDAPTYNNFANWAPERRVRASASQLGCVALFQRLRSVLKEKNPELMMFTEPSGIVLRESMDVNYNYDELWLLPALMNPQSDKSSVETAADLASWMEERDETLPVGALTAHHLDSHDTFWWPAPGRKWRREQIGLPATRAFMWVLALCGGPYMTFVGGEVGIEDDLRKTLRLRRERAELRTGVADYSAVSVDRQEVFAVVRREGEAATLVLVNLSPTSLTAACTLLAGLKAPRCEDYYRGTPSVAVPDDGGLLVELGPFELALVELERSRS